MHRCPACDGQELSEHVLQAHVFSPFTTMLSFTAMVAQYSGIEELYAATQPLCAGCGEPVHVDGLYFQTEDQTEHCHDKRCLAKARRRGADQVR